MNKIIKLPYLKQMPIIKIMADKRPKIQTKSIILSYDETTDLISRQVRTGTICTFSKQRYGRSYYLEEIKK